MARKASLLLLWWQSMIEITSLLSVVKTLISVFAIRWLVLPLCSSIGCVLLHFFPLPLGFGEVFIVHVVHVGIAYIL